MPVSGCASPEVLQCTHLKGARSDRRYRVLGPHPRPARSWESPLRQSGHSRVLCGRRPPGKGLRPRPWATHGSAETRFPGSSELTPFTSGMRSSGSAAIASSCPKTRGGARPPGGCFFFFAWVGGQKLWHLPQPQVSPLTRNKYLMRPRVMEYRKFNGHFTRPENRILEALCDYCEPGRVRHLAQGPGAAVTARPPEGCRTAPPPPRTPRRHPGAAWRALSSSP